jgi:hypothetical protein
MATALERENLEAHVDLCEQRYVALEGRIVKVEEKLDSIAEQMASGQASLVKVIIGAAGTIVAGLLSTIIVILMNLT